MSNFLWMQTKCNVSLDFCLWYKCFMTKMQMQFLWCRCPLAGMPWCECPFVGMPWCESYDAKCLDANTIYSKVSFIFKMRLSQRLKNIFKTQSIIPEKSPSFLLKAPKKLVITVENPQTGIDLESDDLAQKIYFHNLVEQKGWHVSKVFSEKMNFLKIKHFKKIHFSLVSEYSNLTSVKTHRDRLRNSGKTFFE